MNAISICQLSKRYPSFTLDNVSFDVPQGQITGLVGPNGAGKTTTIQSIMGKLHHEGKIEILGNPAEDKLSDDIGYVSDHSFYIDQWTCLDVEKAVAPFYQRWDSEKYRQLLDHFHIEVTKQVKNLSRGMHVKLMLAQAFSHDAKLLILDEPTSGLDPVARDNLCDLLLDYVDAEHSVLFSTHITSDLERVADKIVFLADGQLIFEENKQVLQQGYLFVKGQGGDTSRIIGLKKLANDVEGILARDHRAALPASQYEMRLATLDEILLFTNRERGGRHV